MIWWICIAKILQDSFLGQQCTATDVVPIMQRLPGSWWLQPTSRNLDTSLDDGKIIETVIFKASLKLWEQEKVQGWHCGHVLAAKCLTPYLGHAGGRATQLVGPCRWLGGRKKGSVCLSVVECSFHRSSVSGHFHLVALIKQSRILM